MPDMSLGRRGRQTENKLFLMQDGKAFLWIFRRLSVTRVSRRNARFHRQIANFLGGVELGQRPRQSKTSDDGENEKGAFGCNY